MLASKVNESSRSQTYTIDSKEASNAAEPATTIVAFVNFSPVPPDRSLLPAIILEGVKNQ